MPKKKPVPHRQPAAAHAVYPSHLDRVVGEVTFTLSHTVLKQAAKQRMYARQWKTMEKRLRGLGLQYVSKVGCALTLAAALPAVRCEPQTAPTADMANATAWSMALVNGGNAAQQKQKKQKHQRSAANPNERKPDAEIPVGPLGFAPPAPFYIGDRYAQVSLDFLDENSLLFTFRVPGLIARGQTAASNNEAERHIHAVVLSIPDGKINAETLWTLHDHARYLWKLRNGRFILRDRDSLEVGDSSLHLAPYLRFPGEVNHIELDPEQNWLVADTTEPIPARQEQAANGVSVAAEDLPLSAAASVVTHGGGAAAQRTNGGMRDLVRILDAKTGKVRLYSQVNGVVHLPVDGEGYYEALRGDGDRWMIAYEYFSGQTRNLGWVQSICDPPLDVPAPNVVVASGCLASGERQLSLLRRGADKDQGRLWTVTTPPNLVWPQLRDSDGGLRLARATLAVNHPVGIYNPLDASDIRGQMIQVFDLATGKPVIIVPASPVLDGGGNFALSPSGNRLAVLNAGSIQIYNLPPAPAMPEVSSTAQPAAKP
ncbi:hypothetical protein ACFPT7_19410 [Acidicapsa dinghuensis]|uniref:WD40 repeat domain-containing protein n=2 Tax=Acidicapsa dinghuensis TaxID=2218256 RepID=A0ABW1EJK2_9BACT